MWWDGMTGHEEFRVSSVFYSPSGRASAVLLSKHTGRWTLLVKDLV